MYFVHLPLNFFSYRFHITIIYDFCAKAQNYDGMKAHFKISAFLYSALLKFLRIHNENEL